MLTKHDCLWTRPLSLYCLQVWFAVSHMTAVHCYNHWRALCLPLPRMLLLNKFSLWVTRQTFYYLRFLCNAGGCEAKLNTQRLSNSHRNHESVGGTQGNFIIGLKQERVKNTETPGSEWLWHGCVNKVTNSRNRSRWRGPDEASAEYDRNPQSMRQGWTQTTTRDGQNRQRVQRGEQEKPQNNWLMCFSQ